MILISDVNILKAELLKESISRGYNIKLIQKGLDEAFDLHKEHKRKSGEPYIIHPLNVALEIAKIDLGTDSVIASLLHDTIEDCGINKEYLEEKFGIIVGNLVDGVTKIDAIADKSTERYTELLNLRKFLISAASDIRVLLIKLADRLHNMRTIEALKPEKQIIYADETLKVYVPLCEYIGMGKWKRELEDIAFRKKEPEIYELITKKINEEKKIRENLDQELIDQLRRLFVKNNQRVEKIYGRIKSAYSIYNKLNKQFREGKIDSVESIDISKIKDLIGVSVILKENELDCYKVLGLVHSQFEHSPKDFDDYITRPKKNGYRSIQTTIYYKDTTAEIQIKTQAMHDINEFGAASHIAYKISGNRNAKSNTKFGWIKNLTSWATNKNNIDDQEKYKLDVFDDKVFAVSPKGRVIELRKGSNVLDFAYFVHTEVGNRFLGAKINGNIVKIDTKISDGDVVEILTSKNTKVPSSEWLKIAYLASTRNKIRRALLAYDYEKRIAKGKKIITDYILETLKLDLNNLDTKMIRTLYTDFKTDSLDEFYFQIESGRILKKNVQKYLVKLLHLEIKSNFEIKKEDINQKKSSIHVEFEGISNLDYKVAGCCSPEIGDEIIGAITLRDGLKIHKKNCQNLKEINIQKHLNAKWV